ncbi:MAG TPA: acyl-CoA dehydrogenase family protein [Jatrophihabitantaceae bacterium]|nr:acyl-CoA dehydrogenase family protein [Jatrophihabitantaceae bacterium]
MNGTGSGDGFSAEQLGLRDAVRALLKKRSDSAAVRQAIAQPAGYDEALWRLLCEQIGVAALGIPEEFGGAGAGALETHLVLDELGRTLTPTPLLGSAVLAARLLLVAGDRDAGTRLLPLIAEGGVVAVCWAGADGDWTADPSAVALADDGTLSGEAHYVLDGDTAERLVVVASTPDGPVLVEVDPDQPGVTRAHTPTMDATRRLARVVLDRATGTRLEAADVRAALAGARDAALVAQTAEQAGAMARLLELTVEYTKVRVQFGRPIGSFQAIKHRLADLHVLVEASRSASYAAAAGTIAPAVAAVHCAEAFFTVAAEAIQLHGGIAITWEHDAHLYFKRAQAGTQLFGAPSAHLARLSEVVFG